MFIHFWVIASSTWAKQMIYQFTFYNDILFTFASYLIFALSERAEILWEHKLGYLG